MAVLLGVAILLLHTSCTKQAPAPLGPIDDWRVVGSQNSSYEFGIDKSVAQEGKASASIRSIKDTINGFGAFMQTCQPGQYLGHRVRMTGFVKTTNVSGYASQWFRVDCDTVMVSFDNMHDGGSDRSIKGTSDWARYAIVLDVPPNATSLSYGALLSGTGQIWFDNVAFEIVDTTVSTTGIFIPSHEQHVRKENSAFTRPLNLDFEK
ncbi:MAG: hypothetical protein JSS89_01500 [Bacteroidetes bacterium]|nr:hypothetical protein [Bacteroidota bacterium]